jgi:hypothetical protein
MAQEVELLPTKCKVPPKKKKKGRRRREKKNAFYHPKMKVGVFLLSQKQDLVRGT